MIAYRKYIPLAVGLLLVFAAWVWRPDLPTAGPLHGRQVIATGPFLCDGESHTAVWTNDRGRPLHIRQAEIWLGMHRGSVADLWVWLALDDGNVLGHSNWDHYADPVGPHSLKYAYAPDFIELQPGQALVLDYGCNDLESEAVADTAVTVWYLR